MCVLNTIDGAIACRHRTNAWSKSSLSHTRCLNHEDDDMIIASLFVIDGDYNNNDNFIYSKGTTACSVEGA